MSKVLVIAEIGVNHNGDLKIAEKLIESAASAGANIVKFQAYISGDLATSKAKQANYQKKNSKEYQSQREMLSKFQFDKKNFQYIKDCCLSNNVEFLATAFDFKSLDMLSSFDLQRIMHHAHSRSQHQVYDRPTELTAENAHKWSPYRH